MSRDQIVEPREAGHRTWTTIQHGPSRGRPRVYPSGARDRHPLRVCVSQGGLCHRADASWSADAGTVRDPVATSARSRDVQVDDVAPSGICPTWIAPSPWAGGRCARTVRKSSVNETTPPACPSASPPRGTHKQTRVHLGILLVPLEGDRALCWVCWQGTSGSIRDQGSP